MPKSQEILEISLHAFVILVLAKYGSLYRPALEASRSSTGHAEDQFGKKAVPRSADVGGQLRGHKTHSKEHRRD